MSEIVQLSKRRRARPVAAEITPAPVQTGEFANIRIIRGQFVFDERRGSFHRVSETAAFVLSELKTGRPLEAIIDLYAAQYGISTIVAQRDVELFVNDLPGVGLRRPVARQAVSRPRRTKTRLASGPHPAA